MRDEEIYYFLDFVHEISNIYKDTSIKMLLLYKLGDA